YTFSSLYQGQPRPRGGAVFGSTSTYSDEEFHKLRESGRIRRYVIGTDLAYTKKTYADYSVAVVAAVDDLGDHYIVEVSRKQCEAPEFAKELKRLRLAYEFPTIYWYIGGVEKGVVDTFR